MKLKQIKIYNKIQLMKQMQQIKGFGQQEVAHSIPIGFIRQLQDRHRINESLIQKCMKSIVKQKMSGNLINAQRKKRALQFHSRPHQIRQSNQQSFYGINSYLNGAVKGHHYHNPERYPLQKSYSNNNQSKHRRNQSLTLQINEQKLKFKQSKYRYALNQTQIIANKYSNKIIDSTKLSQLKKPVQLSFISAIENADDENLKIRQSPYMRSSANTSPTSKFRGSQLRLPKLKKNSNEVSIKDFSRQLFSPTTLIKNVVKKSIQNSINQQFWKYLTTDKNQAQTKKRKTSSSLSDMNQLSNIPSSTLKQKKTPAIKSIKSNSCRENIIKYFQNLPSSFQRLIQFIVSFFQIKIAAQITPQFYSGFLNQIKSANERIWSVIAFIFWDINKVNIINSGSIFNIFKEHNGILDMQQKKQKQKVRTQSKDEKKVKKQKTTQTSTQQINDQINEKTNSIRLIRQDHKQQILKLQNIQKALKIFNTEISRLNQQLSAGSRSQLDPQQLQQSKDHAVSYLQEVILLQPSLKCKDVIPLFSAGDQKLNSKNQHKLQLFPKDLTVKCASSYKQCFIAAEHNEQTRMIRQRIENYKQQLRQKRQSRNKILKQKLDGNLRLAKELNYTRVAESQMGETIKTIALHILGYEF